MGIKKWLISILPRKWQDIERYNKWYHGIYGYLIFLASLILLPVWAAWLLNVCLGIGIEINDKRQGEKADIWDAIATFAAATLHTIIYYLFFVPLF